MEDGRDWTDLVRERSLLMRLLVPPRGQVPWGVVRFRHVSVFGPPESGKTTFALWTAAMVESMVSAYFAAVRALTVSDALEALERVKLKDPFYVVLIVDDAEAGQASLRQMSVEVVEAMRLHNTVRHQLAERGLRTGIVALIYCTQRFQNLQRLFRQGHAVVFKALAVNSPEEEAYFRQWLGDEAVDDLLALTEEIYFNHRDDVKSAYYVRTITGEGAWERFGKPRRPMKLFDAWAPPVPERRRSPIARKYGGHAAQLLSPAAAAKTVTYAAALVLQQRMGKLSDSRLLNAPQILHLIGVVTPTPAGLAVDENAAVDFIHTVMQAYPELQRTCSKALQAIGAEPHAEQQQDEEGEELVSEELFYA